MYLSNTSSEIGEIARRQAQKFVNRHGVIDAASYWSLAVALLVVIEHMEGRTYYVSVIPLAGYLARHKLQALTEVNDDHWQAILKMLGRLESSESLYNINYSMQLNEVD